MAGRPNIVDQAARRADDQVRRALEDAHTARLAAGVSQGRIARALGCSRQLVTAIERHELQDIGVRQLARYCAAVGLDLPIRTYPTGAPLRDIGQLRLLERFRATVGDAWTWRAEVPIGAHPRDLRAVDTVIARGADRVGVEAVTRLVDSQGQVRPILQKQEAADLPCMILLLADTRLNRHAVEAEAATLRPAFPLGPRVVLSDLRAGRTPAANGIVLL